MILAGPLMLRTEAETARLAAALAPRLRRGDALLLQGPLGAGKSAFARALIRARLGDPTAEVPSPTYTLVQTYGDDGAAGGVAIWHADLYRLVDPRDGDELGLTEAMAGSICLIEWPERLGPLTPAGALRLAFEMPAEGAEGRRLTLAGPPAWGGRLAGLLEATDA